MKKKDKYKKEQLEIIDKIFAIIPIINDEFNLYDLDNDKIKQQKIMDLTDDIKKYFTIGNIKGFTNEEGRMRER